MCSGERNEPDIFDYAISSIFTSPYYIGSEEIHIPIPIMNPDNSPAWIPDGVKALGSAALNITQIAAQKGLIRSSEPGARFTMKYGVLRGKLDAMPSCAACAADTVNAGNSLTNINEAERSRRINVGYTLAAAAAAGSFIADVSGAPFSTRFAVALPLALGWAFVESGRTGL